MKNIIKLFFKKIFLKIKYTEKMVLTWIELDNLYKEGNLKKYITDNNRNTVLWWASDRGYLEVVKYLVEKCGADVRDDNEWVVR